jgi:protein phosphatase
VDEEPEDTKIIDDGHTQKLPDLEVAMLGMQKGKRLMLGQFSDVGQVRTNNQDGIGSFMSSFNTAEEMPEFGIFVVADGMGGHHDGEKASAVTVRVVLRYILEHIYLGLIQGQDGDSERPTISDVLRDAIQKANQEVAIKVPEGGTTVTAATIMGDLTYIAHVGDSRAYVIDKDKIDHVTRDHSLVQRLIELEQLTPDEAVEHPQRNVLYRAIGQNDNVEVDIITRRLGAGARLLLCSDGLWNMVPDEEIRNVVNTTPNPQIACEGLVKMANDRGGPDNISVIIVRMPD